MIKLNTTGQTVKTWQSFLIQKGYLKGDADGIFGPLTQAATKAFQTAKGLVADGIVGNNTLRKAAEDGFTAPDSAKPQPGFPLPNTIDAVFDLSHYNPNPEFVRAKAAGMIAVFHKATDGLCPTPEDTKHCVDGTYADGKAAAQKAGLLWGAYHFGRNEAGAKQADHFLDVTGIRGNVLPVLDFEPVTDKAGKVLSSTMLPDQAVKFVERIKERTGKYPGLYSGASYLRELENNSQNHTALSQLKNQCWLWLAEYGHKPNPPADWQWTFWQYTDGTSGPWAPKQADGKPLDGVNAYDRSLFNGDEAALRTFWESHSI